MFLSYGLQFLLFEDLCNEAKTSNTIPSITNLLLVPASYRSAIVCKKLK